MLQGEAPREAGELVGVNRAVPMSRKRPDCPLSHVPVPVAMGGGPLGRKRVRREPAGISTLQQKQVKARAPLVPDSRRGA